MNNSIEIVRRKSEDFPLLSSGEIHVWQLSTAISPAVFEEYKRALSAQELARIPYFEFEKVRNSFVCSQGALRLLLSEYLGIQPGEVKIRRMSKGKPFCADGRDIHFNMSNSGEIVVIAFSPDGEVGLDIEQIRHLPDQEQMILKNFTSNEIKYIRSKPNEEARRFFRFWTIKESYLKAIGEGMRLQPDSIEFSIDKNDCVRQLSVKGFFETEDWNFKEFSISTDYVGTLTFGYDNALIKHLELKL